jgi:general secretion pathway protein H
MLRRRRPGRSRAGITLVEILIVIALVAVAASGASFAVGALTRTRLRSASVKVLAASRFAYNRAVSHGNTVRVVLDFDGGKFGVEEAHGRVVLARNDDQTREELDEDEASVDPWEAARARLEQPAEKTFGSSPWGPVIGRDGSPRKRLQVRPLPDGVRLLRLIVPHEPEPREDGKGAIYFFPGGRTEHAVVQLSDPSDTVYSIEIHPLTGRGKIHDYAFEPEPLEDGEGFSDAEDPG